MLFYINELNSICVNPFSFFLCKCKRLYLEKMESIFREVDKVILDQNVGGEQGVVPYLPLNQLRAGGNN